MPFTLCLKEWTFLFLTNQYQAFWTLFQLHYHHSLAKSIFEPLQCASGDLSMLIKPFIFHLQIIDVFGNNFFKLMHKVHLVMTFNLNKQYIFAVIWPWLGLFLLIFAFIVVSFNTHLLTLFIFKCVILFINFALIRFPYYLQAITKMVVFVTNSK